MDISDTDVELVMLLDNIDPKPAVHDASTHLYLNFMVQLKKNIANKIIKLLKITQEQVNTADMYINQ